jgi:hypothetical protein
MICNNASSLNKTLTIGGNILNTTVGDYFMSGTALYNFHGNEQYVFIFNYMNNIVDINNRTTGYEHIPETKTETFYENYTVYIKNTITKNVMITDENYIFNIFPNVERTFYTSTVDIIVRPKSDREPASLNIFMTYEYANYAKYFQRSYMKIDSLLANIFSITQVLSAVLILMNYIFNHGNLEYTLMKHLYIFDDNTSGSNMIIELKDANHDVASNNGENVSYTKLQATSPRKSTIKKSNFWVFSRLKSNIRDSNKLELVRR